MKIGPIETRPPTTTAAAERKSGSQKAAAVPSTEVALSSAATQLGQVGAEATFDSAKVERIATAIREGSFKVNAEAIADKLIINAEELLGRPFS